MLVPTAVSEIMRVPAETIEPSSTAREAATRLIEEGIGSLVVCEAGAPIGIVTEIDVTQLVAEGSDPTGTSVRSCMSSPLVTTTPDTAVEAAAERMREHTIKRLPVVDDDELVGIVTTTDLSNYLPHLARMNREAEPDPERERFDVRPDTAYENEEWDFEYHGGETSIAVGDEVTFSKTLGEADVEAFAEASGDTNRLHLDADYAAGTRFEERIAHGTLVAGLISAALARLPGLTIYLSQNVSYLGPVPLEDRVTARCRVVEDVGRDRYRLATTVDREDGTTVIDGEAVVISDPLPE